MSSGQRKTCGTLKQLWPLILVKFPLVQLKKKTCGTLKQLWLLILVKYLLIRLKNTVL